MMKPINKQINGELPYVVAHMHNMLLQQLLMAGVPGFLIYFLLLLSLTVRILKCWFRKEDKSGEETLALGIALTGAMLYGMFEPLLCDNKPFMSVIFCILTGCFVGELSDRAEKNDEPAAEA